MKKKIFTHPKSHWIFWYRSRFASGSVSQRYRSEDPDPHQDPYQKCRRSGALLFALWLKNEHLCTALPKAEFFIEPPPDTQQRRRRRERGIGITRGSYLLLTSLSPLPPRPPHCAPAALPGAALSGLAERRSPPSLHSTPPWPKISDFQERRLKRRTASF